MTETKVRVERPAVVLHTRPALEMDEEQFFEFCQLNKDWRIERSAEGDLEDQHAAPPTGKTGRLRYRIRLSGCFVLPDGATRSPDASWLRRERLADLTAEQKQRFLPLCPDFVIEVRSPSDPMAPIEAKMREYVKNGARLGWLIDPEEHKVHVYRPNDQIEIADKPDNLSGDPILPGFVLDLKPIWEPGL